MELPLAVAVDSEGVEPVDLAAAAPRLVVVVRLAPLAAFRPAPPLRRVPAQAIEGQQMPVAVEEEEASPVGIAAADVVLRVARVPKESAHHPLKSAADSVLRQVV